ncbi:MAG TPA: cysteine synthase family protein [Ignavibacteria bacterium]|nr:cysteine synthase family protein [Ignavibacteria bacterium]
MLNLLDKEAIDFKKNKRENAKKELYNDLQQKRFYHTNTEYSILEKIGNTPLLKINNITRSLNPDIEIYAKAEWFNPGGSVKDRIALNMILEGEKNGLLNHSKTIIDATSGNTGISYAFIAAIKGYKVKLALPSNASEERKKILKAYGAELIFTDPMESTDGAQRVIKKLYEENPGKYYYPDQYNNTANWQAHYKTTANEIWKQTSGRITHFISGLGTTGTFVGTSKRLKELNPSIKTMAFQPDSPLHGLEGLKHLPTSLVPGIYDESLVDEMLEITTEESYDMVKKLAKEEGLLVGISSGAAMAVCIKLAKYMETGIIVTVFPDSGMKYLSDRFW